MPFKQEYASVYDTLYNDKDYKKECDYLEALFRRCNHRPSTILDLGCGTGGHDIILAQRGYKITGVDRSLSMLSIARKKAQEKKLSIEFIEGDITEISLHDRFDAIISMTSVMSYQTTNQSIAAVCHRAKEYLNPGGLFLFDCWHGPAVLADRPAPCLKEISINDRDRIIEFTKPEIDSVNHMVNLHFRVWKIQGNVVEESCERHPLRFLFPREVGYFMEVAGFDKVEYYPFAELHRELKESDGTMMVVAR